MDHLARATRKLREADEILDTEQKELSLNSLSAEPFAAVVSACNR